MAIGVAMPDKIMDGIITIKEPKRACCMVVERDETKRPTPTMVMMKQSRAKIKAQMVPRKGTSNHNTAPPEKINASMRPKVIPGSAFPIRISSGVKGATNS